MTEKVDTSSIPRRRRLNRWMNRAAVSSVTLAVVVFVYNEAWMSAYAQDIEFAVLSHSKSDLKLNVCSPTGPSDAVVARLRRLGINISRKAPDDYGIDISILPTGPYSARVQVDELYGPLTGSGYYIFVRLVNGAWIVDRVEQSYQV